MLIGHEKKLALFRALPASDPQAGPQQWVEPELGVGESIRKCCVGPTPATSVLETAFATGFANHDIEGK